jgi:hypothetical protein
MRINILKEVNKVYANQNPSTYLRKYHNLSKFIANRKNFIKKNESNLFEKKLFKIYGNILKIKINKKNITNKIRFAGIIRLRKI